MEFDKLSQQYRGELARQYDSVREGGRKWRREQEAIDSLLGLVPSGATTLDVPVGTGRLFDFYARKGFNGTGVDISPEMLAEAAGKADRLGLSVDLRDGDIRRLPFTEQSFDLVMCIRFLNWVDLEGLKASLVELSRVSRRQLLVGIRHMAPLADFRPTLSDLTRIVRRALGHAQARARNSGLIYHEKADVLDLFNQLGLSIESSRTVERRSDGTDYLIYLLEKLPAHEPA